MTGSATGAFPIRRFAATRISNAVAVDLRVLERDGVIESIHRSAVNVRWGGGLLTIAHESVGGLPNGILIVPPLALNQFGLARGMTVKCDGETLRIPAASLVVHLSGAVGWSPAMPVVGHLATGTRAARARRALRSAADHAPRIGLGSLLGGLAGGEAPVGSLGRAAAASLVGVVEALRARRMERAVSAASPLIGLGPGATPSGDDLLVGLAAGLAVTDHILARPFAAGVARNASGMTTSLAETLLTHAGRLEFAERVHRAAVGVMNADAAEMKAAVIETLTWGASSGSDLLVGLLVGIQLDARGLARRLRACATEPAVAA
ncbi:MAG: DUF2877 domain-containing protein [Chloroflexota bacterium]